MIDISYEAGAQNISVRFDGDGPDGRRHVRRTTISDDGEGMSEDVLDHYFVIDFSTRWMRRDTIGKYGVGTKLAALNYATRIDVYSRQSAEDSSLAGNRTLCRAAAPHGGRGRGLRPVPADRSGRPAATAGRDRAGGAPLRRS